jgi:hypothetical protein
MAQGDLFSDLLNSTGLWNNALNSGVINMKQLEKIQATMVEQQKNMYETKRDMLKSDYKGLNVFKRIASSGSKILEQTGKINKTKKTIQNTEKQLVDIAKDYEKAKKNGNLSEADALKKQHQALQVKNAQNKIGLKQMQQTIPVLGKLSAQGGKIGAVSDAVIGGVGGFMSIIPIIGDIIGGIIGMGKKMFDFFIPIEKAFGVFLEMQTTVGNLAADIGLTEKGSRNLLNNFASLSISAMNFGGSMKDVATIIQQFSEVTGKNRLFNEKEVGQLVELGLGTGLGVQGASELAASFDNIGVSLENTINLTDRARNLAAKYNVNTTKVLKTYQGLVQSLTGIGFGKGLDNLTKLAAKATAIRFDIVASTKAFADAFFDPEKAVEASARMQTLGGKFAASFGDPMQLAFESMTDPTALAEKFANTVSGIVQKDGEGNYFISPADRKMLKIAAETLGQNYEDAVATAIEQKKIADKMTVLSKAGFMGIKEDDKPAIASLMKLGEGGKYGIDLGDGTVTLLESITDKSLLNRVLEERKKSEQAAMGRKNIMERFEMIYDRFVMGFSNVFTNLFNSKDFSNFLVEMESAGTSIAKFISEDVMGENGFTTMFKGILASGKTVFEEIQKIFSEKKGEGILDKLGKTVSLLFNEFVLPSVIKLFKYIMPLIEYTFGSLLEIIGDVLPGFLGGDKAKRKGLEMQKNSLSSDVMNDIFGKDEIKKQQKQKTSEYEKSKEISGGERLINFGTGGLKSAFSSIGNLLGLALGDTKMSEWAEKQGLIQAEAMSDMTFGYMDKFSGYDPYEKGKSYGNFDDGVIYKDGSYGKFGKGDMVQFIDQAAMERASSGYGSGGNMGNGTIQHGGTIIIKSDDGKVVTWDQMYNARDLIGSRISSINKSYENGFGNYQNSNVSPIKPLM